MSKEDKSMLDESLIEDYTSNDEEVKSYEDMKDREEDEEIEGELQEGLLEEDEDSEDVEPQTEEGKSNQQSKQESEEVTGNENKGTGGEFDGESLESTGIELYYNGKLYNTEDNLEKVKKEEEWERQGNTKNDEEEVEEVKRTQSTHLTVIDYKTVLDHINREEIKKDYFRYYRSIEYTPGTLKEGVVDLVTAWVYFKSIRENGNVEEEGVSMVDIPLSEDDRMEFVSRKDAEDYFDMISEEDSLSKSEGIQEKNGNRYVYFKSEENKEIFDNELVKWEEHFNDLLKTGKITEYMKDKGYKPKKKKVVENKQPENEELNTKEDVQTKTEESNDDRKNKQGYFKMEVDEVITGLRKQDLAIRGVYRFVDIKMEEIRSAGVSDICLKEVLFEYEWSKIEGIAEDVSQSIIFYYKFDLVTHSGVTEYRLPMRVKLTSLNNDGKPYITKDDFGDLIIKTDNLISEIDKKGYHKFVYKGLTVYLGKTGIKNYKEYLKESGIEESKGVQPVNKQVEGDTTNTREDTIALIKRLYGEVQSRVDYTKHHKSNEMLLKFMKMVNKDKNRPAQVQFNATYEGVCIVMEKGNLLNMDYLMGDKGKGKRGNKGEVLVIHPYFVIATNGEGVSRVVYKKLTSPMSLDDLENMLVSNGYESLSGLSKVLNLRNYSKFKAKNNPVSDVLTRGAKSGASRAVGNAVFKGTKYAGKALIGANKKKRR